MPDDARRAVKICTWLNEYAQENPQAAEDIAELAMMSFATPENRNVPDKTQAKSEEKPASKQSEKVRSEKLTVTAEALPVSVALQEKPQVEVVKSEAVAVNVTAPEKPKPAPVEKPLTQVELAMRHMQQLEEAQTPAVKPEARAKKDVPVRPTESAIAEKPVIEIAELSRPVLKDERPSAGVVSEKPVELPAAAIETAFVRLQEAPEMGMDTLQETPEYALFEDEVPSLELPIVIEVENGPELDYDAMFQEMVAELASPSTEADEVGETDAAWPEGLFELDSLDELIVNVQQEAEAYAMALPEVVPEVVGLQTEIELADEAMPLPMILEVANSTNEVLGSAGLIVKEVDGEAVEPILATTSTGEQDETRRTFMKQQEVDTIAEADETNELDYQNPESLFSIMRELMWSPSASDFATYTGSAGHRLGRMLVQLITGRADIPPAFALA
ncbi:MAG TPA: hypothetical protein VFI84_03460 [Candidatus Saccharimonadales bacterium]|nr:hypothetical protein [Candidatus Saccharimonadales bacterium]